MSGGAGADIFSFLEKGTGKDTITDFKSSQGDRIDFGALSGVDEFSDLRIQNDASGNAVISWGTSGDQITLTGVDAANVTESDFLFG
jgi:hypothetical protein